MVFFNVLISDITFLTTEMLCIYHVQVCMKRKDWTGFLCVAITGTMHFVQDNTTGSTVVEYISGLIANMLVPYGSVVFCFLPPLLLIRVYIFTIVVSLLNICIPGD